MRHDGQRRLISGTTMGRGRALETGGRLIPELSKRERLIKDVDNRLAGGWLEGSR